jgi:ribosomal protein S18 acetylase RimI-like enzyme
VPLRDPEPLSELHHVDAFDCGEPSLDIWLKEQALKSQVGDTARTYVVTDDDGAVIGFVSLASGSVRREQARGALARNAPDPIPVAIIARLAVDSRLQGGGVGTRLLVDALKRIRSAADNVAVKAVIVNPVSDAAAEYYEANGFRRLPQDASTLYLTLAEIRSSLN